MPIEEKESYRWLKGYQCACDFAENIPDIDRSESKSDIEAGESSSIPQKLFEQAEGGEEVGTVEFEIKSKEYLKKVKGNRSLTVRSSRKVQERIKVSKVTPKPPYRKGSKLAKVTFWGIHAEEIDPPEGEDPICWILLTSKPVKTFEDAVRILKLYLNR